jgi:hypothetical protein
VSPRAGFAARIILATGAVDRAYRIAGRAYALFDRLRSELVSALASDAVLDRFNELAYARTRRRREAVDAHMHLFPWEQSVVNEFFPRPPARVLVGGAGGGREAFMLAKMGFEVVAFEPSRPLAEAMAARASEGTNVDARRGSYQEMDRLLPPGESPLFQAAILGFGSFSHLRNERTRIATLRLFGRLTEGPILVSFTPGERAISPRLARFRQLLPRRRGRDFDAAFTVGIGFFHSVDQDEVRSLARRAQLEIVKLDFDERDVSPPYAVLAAQPDRRPKVGA